MKGIDLSHYQKGLELEKLTDVDFVILKLTEGSTLRDDAAFDFYRAAFAQGLPTGGYCYSHALDGDAVRAEARFLLETVKGFPLPCGVYLDLEEPRQLALSAEALREIASAFCDEIRRAGYTPGIYGSEGTLWTKLRPEALPEDALIWVARYGREPDTPCDLWQSSADGRVEGYAGPVDLDLARSDRFRELVRPAQAAPDARVAVLQLLLHDEGRWETVDGIKSPAFFKRIREMIDRMEAG